MLNIATVTELRETIRLARIASKDTGKFQFDVIKERLEQILWANGHSISGEAR